MTTDTNFPADVLDAGLALKFHCDGLHEEVTVRGYFAALLTQLWNDGEGFSGKRPFGNIGWQGDLDAVLIKSGMVPGELDEDGYAITVDDDAANKLIFAMIAHMGK